MTVVVLKITALRNQATFFTLDNSRYLYKAMGMWTYIPKALTEFRQFDFVMWHTVRTSHATWCLSVNFKNEATGGTIVCSSTAFAAAATQLFVNLLIDMTNLSLRIYQKRCPTVHLSAGGITLIHGPSAGPLELPPKFGICGSDIRDHRPSSTL